jgi:hypothetical protein
MCLANKPAVFLSCKLNRKIDMSDKKSIQSPKDNILISDRTGNEAAARLAEEELEQVVGGYIGETEKNLNSQCER